MKHKYHIITTLLVGLFLALFVVDYDRKPVGPWSYMDRLIKPFLLLR